MSDFVLFSFKKLKKYIKTSNNEKNGQAGRVEEIGDTYNIPSSSFLVSKLGHMSKMPGVKVYVEGCE